MYSEQLQKAWENLYNICPSCMDTFYWVKLHMPRPRWNINFIYGILVAWPGLPITGSILEIKVNFSQNPPFEVNQSKLLALLKATVLTNLLWLLSQPFFREGTCFVFVFFCFLWGFFLILLVTSDRLFTNSYTLSQHRGKTLNFT